MKFTWKQIVEFLIGPQESGVRAKDSSGRKSKSKARKAAAERGRGRPKGSKNKKKKTAGHTNKKPRVGENRSH